MFSNEGITEITKVELSPDNKTVLVDFTYEDKSTFRVLFTLGNKLRVWFQHPENREPTTFSITSNTNG